MRAAICFFVAAVLSAAVSGQLSGCELSSDCTCPPTPALPDAQGALPINEASAYDAVGNEDTLPIDPRGGTIEIRGDQVLIRYEHEGLAREVIYDVSELE